MKMKGLCLCLHTYLVKQACGFSSPAPVLNLNERIKFKTEKTNQNRESCLLIEFKLRAAETETKCAAETKMWRVAVGRG